jgi:NUMOD4 motif
VYRKLFSRCSDKKPANCGFIASEVISLEEKWKRIDEFPLYDVSTYGRIRSERREEGLALSQNQYGVVQIGLFKDGIQHHRGVARLVAHAFLPRTMPAFDTPINLDGDRWNNNVENLVWRPRWFAVKYNHQFQVSPYKSIEQPLEDIRTGLVSENSLDCATTYGLLEEDLVESIENHTYVWPTYQQFRVLHN